MRRANRKFIRRFQYMEENLRQGGISLSDADTAQMESLWQEAKKHE
jgi:tetrapyrrole methylase family protein/MazG family protein